MEEAEEADAFDGGRAGGLAGVVHQHREGNPLVFHEGAGVAEVAGSDQNDPSAGLVDLHLVLAQLRGVLAAEQSAKVAQEDEENAALPPEIAQPLALTVHALELDAFELGEVHVSAGYSPSRGNKRPGARRAR